MLEDFFFLSVFSNFPTKSKYSSLVPTKKAVKLIFNLKSQLFKIYKIMRQREEGLGPWRAGRNCQQLIEPQGDGEFHK